MRTILLTICITITFNSFSQHHSNVFHLHNYRQDVSVSISSDTYTSLILSDYGAIQKERGNTKYIYQGQEWDQDLEIYLFPSRLYSPHTSNFFQPDPKSQYFSPYLFVNADPVNITDRDGKEGKPLVLMGIENDELIESDVSKLGSYNYSLVDFLDGNIPDLPEWNGNIFISAHMGSDGSIELEKGKLPGEIKSHKLFGKKNVRTAFIDEKIDESGAAKAEALSRKLYVDIEGNSFGKYLKQFSIERNVKLKNVVFGGCHGGEAAKKASGSFLLESNKGKFAGEKANFFGTKKGFLTTEISYGKNVNWTWIPSDAKISASPDMKVNYDGKQFDVFSYVPEDEKLAYPAYCRPTEPVINDLLEHGRMSTYTQSFVGHYPAFY